MASNSPRELLDAALWSAGLAGHLTHTFAADEVHSPKPSPELYLTACEALGAPPTLRRLRGLGHGYRLGTRRRAVRRRGAVPARHRPRPRLAGVQPGRTQVAGLGRRASRQQGLTWARHRMRGRGVRLRRPRHRLPRRPWRGSRACRPPRSAFRRHRAPGRTFPQWRPLVRPHPEVVALERL
ncbi:hypothetical protein ACFV3N_17325 [Streptomyces bauhiniae]|uniref:hypothetical protein n=1 Tax=Streptomyces bauhiniae TaxID=2340725 RepID=UPI0036594EF0